MRQTRDDSYLKILKTQWIDGRLSRNTVHDKKSFWHQVSLYQLRECTKKYYLLRKVSDLIFFRNLVDFNETRLHEATLNLHTHA
jgi:hypothetical protein